MNLSELDLRLRTINDLEARHREYYGEPSEAGAWAWPEEAEEAFRMPEGSFFDEGPIRILKHDRFYPMPPHHHSFIELNYIYSGVCRQRINGEEVVLRQGQVCLLDSDVVHAIAPMGEQDILINIIMKKEIFATSFLARFGSRGIVSDFLANAVTENASHNRYIVFESERHEELQRLLLQMIEEAFFPRLYGREMLHHYMMIVLTALMRVYSYRTNGGGAPEGRADLIRMLEYIEVRFRTCTLTELAKTFNYNANYLGNLLKKRTGKTFMALVQAQRMMHAAALLEGTDHRVEVVAAESGYASLGFFYRAFGEHFGMTPAAYRKVKRNGET